MGLSLIIIFIICLIGIYFIDKTLKYKFMKYIPVLFLLIYGFYCAHQKGINNFNAVLSYYLFVNIIISCIIVDLKKYFKKKKHKK